MPDSDTYIYLKKEANYSLSHIAGLTVRYFHQWIIKSPVALFTCLLMVALFSACSIVEYVSPEIYQSMNRLLVNSPYLLRSKYMVWQIFTASLMHTSFTHLLLNAVPLLFLIRYLEIQYGRLHTSLFVLLACCIPYAAYNIFDVFFPVWDPTSGASGLLYAAAVLLALSSTNDNCSLKKAYCAVLSWIIIVMVAVDAMWFISPTAITSVNHFVHLSGAAFGVFWWLCIVLKGRVND